MKTAEIVMVALILLALWSSPIWLIPVDAQSVPSPTAHLTKLSPREYVDMSKISYVRLPVYRAAPRDCNDCETRCCELLIVNGASTGFTEEAEARLKELLR